MKRTILALVLVMCLLTGCGGSAPMNNAGGDSATQESISNGALNMGYDKGDYDYGWSDDAAEDSVEMPKAPNASPDGGSVENPLQNAKIIYTADMTLETRDFDQAGSALTALVNSVGGYF